MTLSLARPSDAALPGFQELLGHSVPGPVAAVYETAGSSVESCSPIQVTWRPGQQATVRYRVTATGGSLAGQHDIVATLGWRPDGAATVEGPEAEVGVWVVPHDPLLPGLRSALDLPTVTRLLADLGSNEAVSHARLRAYRPGRRAVVEIGAGRSSIFLKIVPPSQIGALHDRHRYLSDHLPVPDSIGLAPDLGIVVMRTLPGLDLRSVLRRGGPVPHATAIAGMVHGLPDPQPVWMARSPIETLPLVVDLLTHLLPGESQRLQMLVAEIGTEGAQERVPVHGDFHEAQILVEAARPVGLIDVDTFGWGRPGDDAATMLGHLHLLAPDGKSPQAVMDLAQELHHQWDTTFDPVDLRRRTAAVVLGLATGPFRVQRPNWPAETRYRIAAAAQWVESARRIDERTLIATSDRSHVGIG